MNDRLALLARLTRPILASTPLSEQMGTLAAQVCEAFGVDSCIVRSLDGNRLILTACAGVREEWLFASLPAYSGIPREILSTRLPLTVQDALAHPVTSLLQNRPGNFQFCSYAGAPLLVGDQPIGLIGIYTTETHRDFTPTDLEHLQLVANHAAVAMENHRLVVSLQQEKAERERLLTEALERADRDPLTGLLNHTTFYRRLHEATKKAATGKHSFAVVFADMDNFKFFNEGYGHAVGDRVLQRVAERLSTFCGPRDAAARLGGDEFALLLHGERPENRRQLQARLEKEVLQLGFHPPDYAMEIPLHLSAGIAYFPEEANSVSEAVHLADERLIASKRGGSEGASEKFRARLMSSFSGFALLDSLVSSVDSRDRYTRRHSEEVFLYAGLIAGEMGLSDDEHEVVLAAALLHDVGKIGVSDSILRLPMPLTEEQFAAVRQHAVLGGLLAQAAGMPTLVPGIRHHHECYDGSGYPDCLVGEAIPLAARILAVADAFSAMTSDRPYRRGFSHEAACARIQAGAGVQWDRACVAAFLQFVHQLPIRVPTERVIPYTDSLLIR